MDNTIINAKKFIKELWTDLPILYRKYILYPVYNFLYEYDLLKITEITYLQDLKFKQGDVVISEKRNGKYIVLDVIKKDKNKVLLICCKLLF